MNLANLFANSKDAKDYPAGTTVFAQGDAGDVMYVVLEAELDLQRGGRTLVTASAGAIVGEMALINKGAPRSATAIAKTNCRLVPIGERISNGWLRRRHPLRCTSCEFSPIGYGRRTARVTSS
jgi:CRP-like cAMP-binding protein